MNLQIKRIKNFALTVLCSGLLLAAGLTPATAQGLLWEIKSSSQTMHLYGSIHLAKADFYPLPAAVQAAYHEADTLAVEIDASDAQANEQALPLLRYTAPDNLEKHLRAATWKQLQNIAGPALAQLQTYKPAVVATGLALSAFGELGYAPKHGIDLHFIARAKADQKNLVELESVAFQAGVLGGLNDADGDALLKQTLDGMASGELQRETQALIDAWKAADAQGLAKILQTAANKDTGSRKLMKRLLDDRNLTMVEKIHALLSQQRKLFVVVGAGHLAGDNSMVDLFRQQGWQVRQIL